MNTIVLHGSPRKNGNSDTLSEYFIKGLRERNRVDVKHFYANELNIKPCQGCLTCSSSQDHQCIIHDDMDEIYSAFKEADVIVFATPMYWGYMTAQLKTILDRMEALAWDHFNKKTFVVIITYHYHCESTVAFFERIAPFFEIKLHVITCCTLASEMNKPPPYKDISVLEIREKLDEAFNLGKKLGR